MSRRAVAIAFGAAIGLLALWFLLLWAPQGRSLDNAEKRHEAADAANTQLEVRLSRLKDAQKNTPELLAAKDALRRAVPDQPDLAQFILDANDAASTAGVDFLSISPAVPEAGVNGQPPVVKLAITVTGSYFATLDYLQRLEELPRIVVIDTLGLTEGSGTEVQSLSVSITARMFSTSAPQVAPTTTTTAPPAPGQPTTTTTSTTAAPAAAAGVQP
jgi:Tfp pilus assembly protein PilO